MALEFEYSQEQREAQGRVIAQVFDLKSVDHVSRDWSMESANGSEALLSITLHKVIDRETVNALLNGRDLATPEEN